MFARELNIDTYMIHHEWMKISFSREPSAEIKNSILRCRLIFARGTTSCWSFTRVQLSKPDTEYKMTNNEISFGLISTQIAVKSTACVLASGQYR